MAIESADSIEFTPTWIVASVCTVIVAISLFFERFLHYVGKHLKKRKEKTLYAALLKVKEELMLLGFIALMLTVFQGAIQHICIPESMTRHWLPCKIEPSDNNSTVDFSILSYNNDFSLSLSRGKRSLLSGNLRESPDYCTEFGKVPLLSLEAIDQLHIFLFVLAVTHVVLSLVTLLLGNTQINNWSDWEDAIQKEDDTPNNTINNVDENKFVRERFKGFGKASGLVSWSYSFGKQFYGSINEDDYRTLRLGFIMKHCRGNTKFNFYNYMIRALQFDFKKVIGISWYFWGFVVVFLLLNVAGWHAYFWISLVPFLLLFILGAELEHIITKLAHEVVEKHTAYEGDLVVTPSDELFWFGKPKLVLVLIRFILFQNAFEIAYFFWILTAYGFNSCMMGRAIYVIPRLLFSVIVQLVCSYSTLPLYAIVSNMGSSFKKAIFDERMQERLHNWAEHSKHKGRGTSQESSSYA
ncbi:hypothetical protein LUZ60_004392 [Juncus effusus]|nr:hypothetical protein LUZ60_004392 [Juncus effusus]